VARPTVIAAGTRPPLEPDDLDTVELELDDAGDDAAPGSVLAQLRVQAEAQRRARTLELPVGGATTLVIRYRVLDRREWDKYAVLLTPAAAAGGTGDLPPMSVLNARMMAAACETVLFVDDAGEQHDLEVRLDGRLAKLLGHPLPQGMSYTDLGVLDVVDALFASPMAVTAHAGELVTWMQNPADPGDAEGEA
jgi:hypothetical protein